MDGPAVAQPGLFTVLSTETDLKEIRFRPEDVINVLVLGLGAGESEWEEVSQLPREPLVSNNSQWLLRRRKRLCLLILLVF